MAQISIDGRAIAFTAGESIIAVASRSDIEIPHYCWHKRLSVAANCRMCLVDVEKAPKLAPACQTECRDGMVVHTQNERVKAAQRSVHEFLLVNHPIDCPICDQAGECKLQDYYMRYQATDSQMRDEKVHKAKLTRLGPYVTYNAERCIVCTRCVRFMDEVAKAPQLGIFGRADHSVIGVVPGQALDNAYSLNTVDVCPVGALTSTVFRFKQRVWNLRRSDSLCPGCARGCNVHVDQRSSQVYRLLPRENEAVNQEWLCDEGRLTYNRANVDRLESALMRVGAAQDRPPLAVTVPASTPALAAAGALPIDAGPALAACIASLAARSDLKSALVLSISLHATCEEAFVLGRLAREVLQQATVYLLGHPDGEADHLLRLADKNPNRRGVEGVLADLNIACGDAAALAQRLQEPACNLWLAVGHEMAPAQATQLAGQAASAGVALLHLGHAASPLSAAAHVTLPSLAWVQQTGTWINGDGRLQRLLAAYPPTGAAQPAIAWLTELAAGLGQPMCLPTLAAVQAEMGGRLASFCMVDYAAVAALGQPMRPAHSVVSQAAAHV